MSNKETPLSEDFHCTGCNRIFKDQKQLSTHQLTCTLPKKGASFYTAWRELGGNNGESSRVPVTEKVALPSSQNSQNPGEEIADEIEKCTLCSRTFGNSRGLQQHLRTCRKKSKSKHQEQANQNNQAHVAHP